MSKFDVACSGSAGNTLDLKYAHERLNQMVSSDDCSGPLKRAGRLKSQAKKVAPKMSRGSLDAYKGKETPL
ncbi:hypothetical protein [Pseudomonas sp. PGPR40]|uniref:hypothetical protein n=1 Tax=Pseudomonas sp. PGPR40 TaxID=2913476 RepID=UPI001EDAA913|nr:hypothetical protein [Pseudomonas sp. PGPR40]